MLGRNQNKKNKLSDFLRYQNGDMSGSERNSFERELQKDPFSEEAAEGLSSLSDEEISNDISDLQKQVKKRTLKRQRSMIYRIAASVAVLMIVSSVFLIVEKNNTGSKLSEKTVQLPVEIPEANPVTKPIENKDKNTEPLISQRKTQSSSQQTVKEEKTEPLISQDKTEPMGQAQRETPVKKRARESENKPESQSRSLVSDSKVKAAGENRTEELAAPLSAAGGNTRRYKTESDSSLVSISDAAETDNFQAAVADIYTKKDKTKADETYISAKPVDGLLSFEKYILENQKRPDTLSTGQRVVVVINFTVLTDGTIDSLRVLRSPGKLFSDEAIRLIKSGPAWRPAKKNGILIEDKVNLKIVFR
jgi:outer membrane biosynthesis protein TonB